ncbi:MAG: Na/Pi cotransporter family protein [Anaerovoracaceae bacterium]
MDTFKIVTTLLGGLAIFIFGMNLMSDGLQKAAGDKMKRILSMLTANPVLGVLAGALTTAVLQSSSATTVMIIGFVSAGLMKLPQAISVVLGANIGTTITAQLIAFKIGDYAWIFVFIGFILYFFMKKKEFVMDIGQIMFGFGILFVGINTMSSTMVPLASSPVFTDMILKVQDIPVLGVMVGTLMTVIIQSSSATIAVLQNLAATAGPDGIHSVIGLEGALPILFGDNIGTTITALLASIGASINAKRTAIAHTIFNITGTLIFIWFIPQIADLMRMISPQGAEIDVISRQIANAHTSFNLSCTILFLPIIGLLVKVVTKLIPGNDAERLDSEPIYLDEKVVNQPVFAIHLAIQELTRNAKFAFDMVIKSKQAFLSSDKKAMDSVMETEVTLNSIRSKIVNYLSLILSTENTTEAQGEKVSALMHVASDIEHIGDYCKNIVRLSKEKDDNKYEFSDVAYSEIYNCFDHITQMIETTIVALDKGDVDKALEVFKYEEEINQLERNLRKSHMQRVNEKVCSPAFTVVYTDIIHNIERIGDSCKNIAEVVLKGAKQKGLIDNIDKYVEKK